jgi:gliding motility-associated-like protein
MKKMIFLLLLAAGSFQQQARSQVINAGARIGITTNGILFVNSSFTNQSGTILNDGKLILKGDWRNNDPLSSVFNKLSTGAVELSGDDQLIAGTSKTEFPTLILKGLGQKTLGVNTDITGSLELNDHELKADAFELAILNGSPYSITRGKGFISTDKKGKLIRIINSVNTYLFPLGSSENGNSLYRPFELVMKDDVQNYFAASFAKKDASSDGYNRQSKRPDIETVFDKYFYVLDQNGSSKLDFRFYQNSKEDGGYKQLVNWNKFNIWEKAGPSTVLSGAFADGLDQNILYSSTDVITNLPITLAAATIAGPFTFFNAFSPDGDGKNDTWEIKNLDTYPNNDLTVFNRWGDEVFKSQGYSSAKAWNGGNVNPGTYYYILNVEVNGARQSYKGFITMVKKD